MKTAKIFQHGGSQAVRLPKDFRFAGSEVLIEKHGEEVVLRPVFHTQFTSFSGIARHLAENFPGTEDFPEPPPRPAEATLVTGNASEFKRVKGLKVRGWKPA